MKRFDFTKLGGFPLTQDVLKWMQDGMMEALTGLNGLVDDFPCILQDCQRTDSTTGSTTNVTFNDGIVMIDGEIMPFVGATMPLATAKVKVIAVTDNLTFYDSSSQPVKIRTYATLDATGTIPVDALVPFMEAAGNRQVGDWITRTAPLTSLQNFKYRVNKMNKTVEVIGSAKHVAASVGLPPGSIGGGQPFNLQLLTGLPPASGEIYFKTGLQTDLTVPVFKDYYGNSYRGGTACITSTGAFCMQFDELHSSTDLNKVIHHFHVIYPID